MDIERWADSRVGPKPAVQRAVFLESLIYRPSVLIGTEPHVQPQRIVQLRTQRLTQAQLRNLLTNHPRDAARWISKAAEAGFPAAQVVWGQLLLDGRGVDRDAGAAFAWFGKAAAAGDVEARNMVGRCHEQGWGVAPDPRLATEAFEIAAEAGHAWGQINLAQMLMRAGDAANRGRCFALFEAAARSGTSKPHLKAMNSLARFLEEGWAGAPDPAGAAAWYLRAANLGDHWAQYNLATILFGQGDQEAADRWLRTAIAISDNGFRRRIAPLMLARPEFALRQHGLDALARCAEGRAADDLYAYGLALDDGLAGPRDPERASALFKAAVAQGHEQAASRIRAKSRSAAIRRFAGRALIVARRFADFIGTTRSSKGTT